MTGALQRAKESMRRVFGVEARGVGHAPGRVNIIGEHIDYCGGHVLPMTIDRRCAAAISRTSGPGAVHSADLGLTWRVGEQSPPGTWSAYVAGVLALLREHDPACDQGWLITIASDVARGAGLSSSASLELAVCGAVTGLAGVAIDPLEAARLCQRAEREFAGVPCGIMDQAVGAIGREGHAMLLDCREPLAWEHVPIPLGASMLVVDTGVKHALAEGEYAKRRGACERAADKLGVRWLCRAGEGDVAKCAALTDDERRAATHATSEDARVLAATESLRRGDLTSLGRLMYESHTSLRDVYRVSCAELDAVVEAAASLPGVYGARMTGGGFGGSAIVLASPAHAGEIAARLVSTGEARFGRAFTAYSVRAGVGAAFARC